MLAVVVCRLPVMRIVDETHDPALRCWVDSARDHPDFPIQNLPFCVFERGEGGAPRVGVGIGDEILDLVALDAARLVGGLAAEALHAAAGADLNTLMALGPEASTVLRQHLSAQLREGAPHVDEMRGCLHRQQDVSLRLPARIGDYTDFYTSIHHATNIGRLFRPDNPLLPNYKWLPIGYHGRASSVVVSGTDFRRPVGQTRPDPDEPPVLGPCQRLDYELEVGVFVGRSNALGDPITINDAEDHAFGLCLLNDWSARDIQAWEYQPLGPFLAKSFATTVSPWVVTMEALAPFRSAWTRDSNDPAPLDYLDSEANRRAGHIDMQLEVRLDTRRMREQGLAPASLSRSNFSDAYWSIAQMLTHHTVSGCSLMPGDLIGSGTMSGQAAGTEGALIEITRGGANPLVLPNGETRTFLEDGDRVTLLAHCERAGFRRIGFGEATGEVLPSN